MKATVKPILTRILPPTIILALLPAVRSDAASILWDTPTLISADADVSTAGSLLYAYTFGNSSVPSAAVNGVTFASFAASSGLSTVTVGSVTLALTVTGGGVTLESSNTALGSATAPFSNLTAAYKGLLQSGASNSSNATNLTLTLGGLTNGNSYQVQFWANESATYAHNVSTDAKTVLTAGNAATLDLDSTNVVGGAGQWVTGTFTANASTEVLTVDATPAGRPILNGFQVRTVPEPATAGLLGLGAVLLAGRRRRNA